LPQWSVIFPGHMGTSKKLETLYALQRHIEVSERGTLEVAVLRGRFDLQHRVTEARAPLRVFRSLQQEPPAFFTQCLQCAGAVFERFLVFHDESQKDAIDAGSRPDTGLHNSIEGGSANSAGNSQRRDLPIRLKRFRGNVFVTSSNIRLWKSRSFTPGFVSMMLPASDLDGPRLGDGLCPGRPRAGRRTGEPVRMVTLLILRRSARVSPSMYSITRKSTPSCWPTSKRTQICGWLRLETAFASRSNRSRSCVLPER